MHKPFKRKKCSVGCPAAKYCNLTSYKRGSRGCQDLLWDYWTYAIRRKNPFDYQDSE